MSNVLLIILNVLLIGGVIAIVGTLLVRLARRFLLDGLPERGEGGEDEQPSI